MWISIWLTILSRRKANAPPLPMISHKQKAVARWTTHHSQQLDKFLSKYCRPYIWGKTDCLMAIAEYIDRFTKWGFVSPYELDRWHSMSHRKAIVQANRGGTGVSRMCDALCLSRGLVKVPDKQLKPGDLLVVKSPVIVSGVIHYPGACILLVGNGFNPLLRVDSGWRVPDSHGPIAAHYRPILKHAVNVWS